MTTPNEVRMAAVLRQIEAWELDAENDNYSMGDAASDLQAAMSAACTCVALPHDRRCPVRTAALDDPAEPEQVQPCWPLSGRTDWCGEHDDAMGHA